MVHRKLVPSEGRVPFGIVNLTTETRLTLEEATYALDTVPLWSGVKMVSVGKDGIEPVPADRD
jgi:hypothetical protein